MLQTCNSELLENKKFKESEHCFTQLHKSLGEDKYVELKKTPRHTSSKETTKKRKIRGNAGAFTAAMWKPYRCAFSVYLDAVPGSVIIVRVSM